MRRVALHEADDHTRRPGGGWRHWPGTARRALAEQVGDERQGVANA